MAMAVLALLLCAAYGEVLFGGRSLVYSNSFNPLDHRFTAKNYGEGFISPAVWEDRNLLFTANFHDAGGPMWQWEPDAEFVRKGLLAGELPLWNPYVGGGSPEMANLVPAVFFPPYLAMVLLGNTVTLRNLYQLGLLFGAGLLTYAFLRRHGLARAASVFGGCAFMFCGALTQNVGSFLGQTVACIPLALLLTRRFLDRPTAVRGMVLAVGFACVALASFPPVLIVLFGFVSLYAALDVAWRAPAEAGTSRPQRLLRFAAAAALAVGLVGFYYLPALALDRAAPQIGVAYAHAAALSLKPVTLLQLASPILLGASEILRSPAMGEPAAAHIPYAGWVPLLLAALALRPRSDGKRALSAACWGAMVLVGMKLVGLPPVQWIARVPMLAHIHMAHYFGYLFGFTVAVLAGLGLDRLCRGSITPRWLATVGAVAVAGLLGLRAFVGRSGILAHAGGGEWLREWWLMLVAGFVATTLFWLIAVRARSARSVAAPVAALVVLFAVEAVSHTFYPRPKAHETWREPADYVEALLLLHPQRVFSSGAFPANAGGAYEIAQLDSLMAYNAPRMFELYRRFASPFTESFLRNASALPPESVLDGAGIDVLVVAKEGSAVMQEALGRGYEIAYEDNLVRIFRRSSPSRFFFTSDYRVVSEQSALATLAQPSPGLRSILLETAPATPSTANRADDPAVAVEELKRSSYRLRVQTPRPGLVYVSDAWMPGWAAEVDGRPAAILPANYAFRAIQVPAGVSHLSLRYRPPGLTAGLAVSAASLLCLIAAVAVEHKRQTAA